MTPVGTIRAAPYGLAGILSGRPFFGRSVSFQAPARFHDREGQTKAKLVATAAGERTFVLVLDLGEEAFKTISTFAARVSLDAASLTALARLNERSWAGSTSPPKPIGRFRWTSNAKY